MNTFLNICSQICVLCLFVYECQALKTDAIERWLIYHNLRLTSFKDTVNSVPLILNDESSKNSIEQYNLAKQFFIYSPDSSSYIDLNSYSLNLETDSDGVVFSYGSEPDTEISIFYRKTEKKYQLLFLGSDYKIDDAYWFNDNILRVVGFSYNGYNYFPTLWVFDFKQKTQIEVQNISSPKNIISDYTEKVRLKTVDFRK